MKTFTRIFTDSLIVMAKSLLTPSIRIALAALVTGIGTTTAFAQGPPPGVDAAAILRRSSAAMGCSVIGNDTTIAVKGSLRFADGTTVMPVTIQSQGNHRWRSELETPKERKVTIVNDGKGQIQHADGRVNPLAEHNTAHQRPMHIPCLTNLALPPSLIDATYLRLETSGAESFDVIELLPSGRPKQKQVAELMKTTVWISRSTGYLTKLQYSNGAEQDSNDVQPVAIDYSDYRMVNGLAVPFHQISHAGNTLLDLRFDSVQLNTVAADFNLR